jgi:hypothetical protein
MFWQPIKKVARAAGITKTGLHPHEPSHLETINDKLHPQAWPRMHRAAAPRNIFLY